AVADHFMTPLVNHQSADLDSFAIRFGGDTAASSQQGLDAVFEFAWAKRLCEIIVGACFKPRDFVGERVVRSQKERGCLNAAVANSLEQIDPRYTRHRYVEDEAIEFPCECRLECGHSVFAFIDLKTETTKVFR